MILAFPVSRRTEGFPEDIQYIAIQVDRSLMTHWIFVADFLGDHGISRDMEVAERVPPWSVRLLQRVDALSPWIKKAATQEDRSGVMILDQAVELPPDDARKPYDVHWVLGSYTAIQKLWVLAYTRGPFPTAFSGWVGWDRILRRRLGARMEVADGTKRAQRPPPDPCEPLLRVVLGETRRGDPQTRKEEDHE